MNYLNQITPTVKNKFLSNNVNIYTQQNSISFSGYKGLDYYGTSSDKTNLSYKLKLTPAQIDTFLAPSKSIKLQEQEVFNRLCNESKEILKADKSLLNVMGEYWNIFADRGSEIASKTPKGDKIPFFGVIFTYMRDDTQIGKDMEALADDWTKINSTHLKNVSKLNQDFAESKNTFMKKTGDRFKTNLQDLHSLTLQPWDKIKDQYINKYLDIMQDCGTKLYEQYDIEMTKRITKKCIANLTGIHMKSGITPKDDANNFRTFWGNTIENLSALLSKNIDKVDNLKTKITRI